ncbi:hypothetical protein [Desulfovibrio sp. TomC]|uniref:hypothetical protein n=1 Tax=Desulfovibrio sp. TomC TaxID=1562888 RepID=UPI0005733041|nr:hypothetical protein [Desulfovibrio sp. TomC]KHK00820.1 hypothetical protein NY78_3828 [Desulfovibrio sp. TomC]
MGRRPSLVALLTALAAALALAAPGLALDLDPKPGRAPLRLPGELFSPDGATEGRLLVKIAAKKVKYSRVLETVPLALDGRVETPGGRAALTLATAKGGPDIALGRFNEVALDIRDADPDNPTLAALTIAAPNGRIYGSDPLECVDRLGETYLAAIAPEQSVPVARAAWADKNALYLARRVLDLPFDDLWRTTQDGPSTFLQRRFDRDSLDLGAVDIILRRPAPVQLNLVLALDPASPGSRTVLDWYALAKRTFELPDGRTVLRVYVGRYLRERYPGLKWARLKEISLMFFRQGPAEVARDRLIERLVFTPSGFDPAVLAQNGLPGRLPTRVREPFAGSRRVFVNVAQAAAAIGPGGTARMALALAPMAPAQPGGGTAEAAFLALTSPRRDTPAFLAAADELATSLGAAPDISRPDGGVPVAALWSLAPPFARTPGQGPARSDFGQTVADPVFVSGGQGLFTAASPVRLFRTPAGLTVEGKGPDLTMAVDAAFVPKPGYEHFFRLDIGRAPGLTDATLAVFAPGAAGAAKTYALRPGQPVPLPDLPARVSRAEVRFAFSGREFSLPVTRAMLTAVPIGPAQTGLYDAALPWPVTSAALPATVAGQPAYGPRTSLGPMAWLTAGFELVGDPVAVSVDGASPAVPDTRSGILAARLPARPDLAPATVAVRGRGDQPPGQLTLADPVFSGEGQVGWRTIFAALPLLSMGDAPHSPGPISEATAARLNAADDWLGIGPARLPAKAAAVRFFDTPWYGVSALCFETDAPLHLSRFAGPARTAGASGGPGTLGRVLAALALVLAAAAGLRLAGPGRLSRLVDGPCAWLASLPADAAASRRERRLFGGLAAGLWLVALALGGVPGRVVLGLAGLALVPVWRVCAPAVAARLSRLLPALGPWLAAGTGRAYFLGFALALALAAALRSLHLLPASEFCAQAGLYAFLAGLGLQLRPTAINRADTPEDTRS